MSGYTPQTWADGNVAYPPSAARFSYMEAGIFRATSTVVTTLPAGYDGQEVRVRVPATAVGFEAWWSFSFDVSNPTTQPWAFLGGAPAGAATAASFSTASTTYVADGTNGPRVTVPFRGIYLVTASALMSNSTINAYSTMSLAYGAAAVAADEIRHTSPTANAYASVSRTWAIVVAANNQLIECQYGVSAGTGAFANRSLAVTPIRVGP